MATILLFLAALLGAVLVQSMPLSEPRNSDEENASKTLPPDDEPYLECDIIIDTETIPVDELRQHLKRSLVSDPRHLWPGKEVPYEFASGQFSTSLRTAVQDALQDLMDHSCVKFSPRQGQTTYLKLRKTGKGCSSKVGYHEASPSSVHLASSTCQTRGTIQHEFLHALGFWHEHTRPDRDNFVSVLWDNVRQDRKKDFVKRSDSEVTIQGLPYDYASVMHYKHTAFSKPKGAATLVPKNKEAVKVMGQRRGVSRVDIAKLNRLYNCTGEHHYRGDDLEGKETVIGEVIQRERSDKEGKVILEDIFKVGEREVYAQYQKGNKQYSKDDMMKLPDSEVLIARNFDEDYIYSNIEEPEQIRIKKVLVEKVIDTESIKSKTINIVVNKTNEIKSIIKTVLENSPRTKRQAFDMKPPNGDDVEMGEQPATDGQQETFSPQKILPELLKGVLSNDKDKDRPIVIQFAIYQPIVYKSSNESMTSSNKDSKQNVGKPVNEDVGNRKNAKEAINIKEDIQEGIGQIRSLRDRENLYKENNKAPSDSDVGFRMASYDETQEVRNDGFKFNRKDSNSNPRDYGRTEEYSEFQKKEYGQSLKGGDDFQGSTKDFIQPLKVSQNNDDYVPRKEKYDVTGRNSDNKKRDRPRVDYDFPSHRDSERHDDSLNPNEHFLTTEHNSRAAEDYMTYKDESQNIRHMGASPEYNDHRFEDLRQKSDIQQHNTDNNYDKINNYRDTSNSKPRSDYESHVEQSSGHTVDNEQSLMNTQTGTNYESRSSKSRNEEGRMKEKRPDIPDRLIELVKKEPAVDKERVYSDIPNVGNANGERLKEGKTKRQNPRTDLFIEDKLTDKLEKNIQGEQMEKDLSKSEQHEVFERTLPQESNPNPVLLRDRAEGTRDQFDEDNVPPSKKNSYPIEEQGGKQESITDNEDLISKPHSKLNLNPRQALPLNAPTKSQTRRLVRVEKVQG